MDLRTAVTRALFLNELDGNMKAAYRFSNAGGKSGYSFGATQLDVANNPMATTCLVQANFTLPEIRRLKLMDKNIADLDAKLALEKSVVDKFDAIQVQECLDHVQRVSGLARIRYADLEGIVAACDYHNQLYMSPSGQFIDHFRGNQAVTASEIKDFKLTLPWGEKRPDDVERRAENIRKVCSA